MGCIVAMNVMALKVLKTIVVQRCESNMPDLSERHGNTSQEKADKYQNLVFGLVKCFTSQSIAKVMSGRSVHLTTPTVTDCPMPPGVCWLS